MVVGRRDLDHIHPDEIEALHRPQDRQRLVARQPAGHRRARARRGRGIEAIDIEGQIGRPRADHSPDRLGNLGRRHGMDPVGMKDGHSMRPLAVEAGADADLDRALRVDHALAHRIVEHAAMVDPAALVLFDVAMRVELHQRERPVFRGMGLERGIGTEMVAPQHQGRRPRLHDARHMRLDHGGDRGRLAPVKGAVAVIRDRQRVERIETPGPDRTPGMLRARPSDRLGTEARAGAVADRQVEGHPRHRHIDPRQVARVLAAEEAQRSCIARLDHRALELGPAEGRILQRLAHFLRHLSPPCRPRALYPRMDSAKVSREPLMRHRYPSIPPVPAA